MNQSRAKPEDIGSLTVNAYERYEKDAKILHLMYCSPSQYPGAVRPVLANTKKTNDVVNPPRFDPFHKQMMQIIATKALQR